MNESISVLTVCLYRGCLEFTITVIQEREWNEHIVYQIVTTEKFSSSLCLSPSPLSLLLACLGVWAPNGPQVSHFVRPLSGLRERLVSPPELPHPVPPNIPLLQGMRGMRDPSATKAHPMVCWGFGGV